MVLYVFLAGAFGGFVGAVLVPAVSYARVVFRARRIAKLTAARRAHELQIAALNAAAQVIPALLSGFLSFQSAKNPGRRRRRRAADDDDQVLDAGEVG